MAELSILIVEDSDPKYNAVYKALFSEASQQTVHRAPDFSTAQRLLEASHYDLVILDIRVPVLKGGSPASKNSADIVELITRGEAINPSYIIGLTEYPEEIGSHSLYPLEYFSIEKYSTTTDEWIVKLGRHIEYIKRTKIASLNYHDNSFDYDVVILAARHDNEFVPITESMKWEHGSLRDDARFPGFKVRTGGWITSAGFVLRTAVLCIQRTGLSSAAAAASLAIARYRPKVVSMLGMCCGLNSRTSTDRQQLGDIIIMSDTFCWDEGRYSDPKSTGLTSARRKEISFFEARPSSGNISPKLKLYAQGLVEAKQRPIGRALAKAYARHPSATQIQEAGKPVPVNPKVRLGLNVSGSSVVAASAQSKEVLRRFPLAIGLEMECHAVYSASSLCPGATPEAICIKGVADFGDGQKSKEYQQIASIGSLVVFDSILSTYLSNKS